MTFSGPIDELKRYEAYLNQLRATLGQDEGQSKYQHEGHRPEVSQQAQALQKFYQQTLWKLLTAAELSQPQWRSATTELHRHMRLLAVEVSFARSARQDHLRQQRLVQIGQRLEQLQGFTKVLRALITDETLAESPIAPDMQL